MSEIKKKVDNDWKKKAAKEREMLAAKREKKAQQEQDPSQANFTDLIKMLALQAQMALGAPDPSTGQRRADPHAARHAIGLLDVLAEKTRGNLDPQEDAILNQLTQELKMIFVRAVGG